MNRYSYSDILAKAEVEGASSVDVNALGEWFEDYGYTYWNGECFECGGLRVYRIYGKPNKWGDYPIIGYEFR